MAFAGYPRWKVRDSERQVTFRDDRNDVSSCIVVTGRSTPILRKENTCYGWYDTTERRPYDLSRSERVIAFPQKSEYHGFSDSLRKTNTLRTRVEVDLRPKSRANEVSLVTLSDTYPTERRSMITQIGTVSPSLAISVLRENLKTGKTDIRTLLPAECLEEQGVILPTQLQRALTLNGVTLSNSDFLELWSRFDEGNLGRVHTRHFISVIDLDPVSIIDTYVSPPKTTTTKVISVDPVGRVKKIHNKEVTEREEISEVTPLVSTTMTSLTLPRSSTVGDMVILKDRPKLPPSYKSFKHEYSDITQSLLKGFRLFDYNNDGYVTRKQFQRVLGEFGLTDSVEGEALAQFGSHSYRVNYRDFLSKHFNNNVPIPPMSASRPSWQSRSFRTVTDIVPEKHTTYLHASTDSPYMREVRELLEKVRPKVLQQLNYLRTYFQARDRIGLNSISKMEMKGVMDRLYFPLSGYDKERLCQIFDFNNNGRFHYLSFLDAVL